MKILYVASEANPFAASGGLGDVMGALPVAVAEGNPEVTAEVIMPLYGTMSQLYRDQLEKVVDISFNLSWRRTGATIYKTYKDGVCYYFVENHYYFDRDRLYGEWDDGERFAFFSTAVIEFMLETGNIPDILHANDWQTALTVIYLKTKYQTIRELADIRTVYTIHNIEYQGKYDLAILGDIFALDRKYTSIVEYDGCINLMKGALIVSDYVTTVSPNYANELKHDFFAFGLAEIVKQISDKASGIINGIDYSFFSPTLIGEIYHPYTRTTFVSGKAKNKLALQKELKLPESKTTPLIVMITRLTAGKGIDLVTHILEELLSEDVQVVILGTGDKEYEDKLTELGERFGNLRSIIRFDRSLSKKMYAAADIFLRPSKSEPCGLAQMIACAYGTVPVVRAVGGLYDSIIPYGLDGSNGFRFDSYNAHDLLFTLKSALSLYKNPQQWRALCRRAINSDFSWGNSASKYMELYRNLLNW